MTAPLLALQAALRAVADPVRAPAMRAYMRDQFEFLGIPTPLRRATTKPIVKELKQCAPLELLALANSLWQLPEREYQYAALDMLATCYKSLRLEDIPALLALVRSKSWWDSVDGFAAIIGDVLRHQHQYMDDALRHPDFWMRRIALLHQLGWRDKTDSTRLFEYCLALADEKEFFIQKAIGWALRDYARHAPDAVRVFTLQHRDKLAPLSFREANKHL